MTPPVNSKLRFSAAFALSSGTIGAALSGALSLVRSIAISYGTFHHRTPQDFADPAHALAGKIVKKLWEEWGKDPEGNRNGEVDLYNGGFPGSSSSSPPK
jgi:tubulin---tyrosine ligase